MTLPYKTPVTLIEKLSLKGNFSKAARKQIRQLELFEDGEDFGKYRYELISTPAYLGRT